MGAREDRRGRLALQLLERDQRVVAAAQPRRALLDERAHERAVLVQRRPARVLVLDERDRQLGAVVQLAQQERERAEHEAAEGELELRSANGHASGYAPPRRNPVSAPPTSVLAALVDLVLELLDLVALALDLLGALEQVLDAVAVAGREAGEARLYERVGLGQRAGALERGDRPLEQRQRGGGVAAWSSRKPWSLSAAPLARGRRR